MDVRECVSGGEADEGVDESGESKQTHIGSPSSLWYSITMPTMQIQLVSLGISRKQAWANRNKAKELMLEWRWQGVLLHPGYRDPKKTTRDTDSLQSKSKV